MGQSASHSKTTTAATTPTKKTKKNKKKSLVFPKKEYMENFKDNTLKKSWEVKKLDIVELPPSSPSSSLLAVNEKKLIGKKKQLYSKGVATSFGFKHPAVNTNNNNNNSNNNATTTNGPAVTKTKSESNKIQPQIIPKNVQPPKTETTNRFGFRPHVKSAGSSRIKNDESNKAATEEKKETSGESQLLHRYTFQYTELPHPEPVRLIETKNDKTLINTKKQHEKIHFDKHAAREEFFKNNTLDYAGDKLGLKTAFNRSINSNNNSHHEAVFKCLNLVDHAKPVTKWASPVETTNANLGKSAIENTLFKLKFQEIQENSDDSSSSYLCWDNNAGEAMALDTSSINQIIVNGKTDKTENNNNAIACSSPKVTTPKFLDLDNKTLSDDEKEKDETEADTAAVDNDFSCIAFNNYGTLLDDEKLSPLESPLNSSETDTIPIKLLNQVDQSPESPTNHSSSSILPYEKDFLIDDEIADQPGLILKSGTSASDQVAHGDEQRDRITARYNGDMIPSVKHKINLTSAESTPLSLRRSKLYSGSNNNNINKSSGSLDSLISCISIASDDFIIDYDSNCTNDFQRSFSKISKCSSTICNAKDQLNLPNWLQRGFDFQSICSSTSIESLNSSFNNSNNELGRILKALPCRQDLMEIKKMLIKLRMILNEAETDHLLTSTSNTNIDQSMINNNNNNSRRELADLRRQVLFLQVQLENKEETVQNLMKQVTTLTSINSATKSSEGNMTTITAVDQQQKCNAATQTIKNK